MNTIPTYPFDPTGLMASNLIAGEQQIITANNWRDYHFIVPKYAPYFMDSMKIIYQDTDGVQHILVKGVDWYESHEFISASRACANPIFGSISFLNTSLAGVVTLSYQTLGGIWVQDETRITQILADVLHNPRVTSWDEVIDMPYAFPPIDHEWNLVDMVGASDIVAQLQGIEDQLRASGQNGLANHLADVNNPHKVTASQVGLGNVRNLTTATKGDAQAGTSDSVYLTPWSASLLVQALFGVNLGSHLTDYGNPHKVTAAQVGAYSKTEMDNLLKNKLDVTAVAADTSKFNGMLPAEYAAYVLQGTASNSTLFAGRTYLQLLQDVQGGASANALQFNGMDQNAYKAFVLGSGTAYDSARFGGVLYTDFLKNIANSTVFNAQNFNNMSYAQVKADILSGTAQATNTFGGLNASDYAISVLLGTAANAAKFNNMTPAQFAAYVLGSGASADASKFGGMDTNAYKTFVLGSGTAYDSFRFGGLLPADYTAQVLQGTAANATKFAGLTQNDWMGIISTQISAQAPDQGIFPGTTGESARTNYQAIGSVTMPLATDAMSLYPDSYWLVSGGDSAGGLDSSLFLVRINTRDTIGSVKMEVKLISGDGSGATFGYTILAAGAGNPTAVIYIVTKQNMGSISVTDLGSGHSDVLGATGVGPSTAMPSGMVAVNGPYPSMADSAALTALTATVAGHTTSINTLNNNVATNTANIATNTSAIATLNTNLSNLTTTVTQMQTDVAAAFDSLTTAFQALQTSLGA